MTILGNNEMDIEVVEVRVEEVMMDLAEEETQQEEVVQDDIEYVDLLPADAEAEFEFRDAIDLLLPGVNEEVSKYIFLKLNNNNNKHLQLCISITVRIDSSCCAERLCALERLSGWHST